MVVGKQAAWWLASWAAAAGQAGCGTVVAWLLAEKQAGQQLNVGAAAAAAAGLWPHFFLLSKHMLTNIALSVHTILDTQSDDRVHRWLSYFTIST